MTDPLKPCPFCGGKSHYVANGECNNVCCLHCPTEIYCGPAADGMEPGDSRIKWNTRPVEDKLRKALEQVVQSFRAHSPLALDHAIINAQEVLK